MAQTIQQMERRLRQVERDLAELRAALITNGQPWYRQIVGSFANDPAFAEIIRLGRLARQGKLQD
jgi:hypothetical protein